MIVKSLGRKDRCFRQLARYFDRGAGQGAVIGHNLMADCHDQAAVIADFEANASHLAPRKGANWCYHDMIALPAHAAGSEQLTEMLTDLAYQYLSLRAPYQLAYGRLHLAGEKPHVHLMISANAIGSARRVRLSRQGFQAVRLQLENYKLGRWPALPERLFGHDRYGALQQAVKEKEVVRRTGTSRRRQLAMVLEEVFAQTQWWEELVARLGQQGLVLYRRGKAWGVEDLDTGRRHRFNRLGLERGWEALQKRMEGLQQQLAARQHVPALGLSQAQGRERIRNLHHA